MLTITQGAIEVIRGLADEANLPEGGGLRIATDLAHREFVLSLERMPLHGDVVVEVEGARVFLDSAADKALENVSLGVTVDESGAVHLGPTDDSDG